MTPHDRRAHLTRARDLFNGGHYWLAHEALETVWRSILRDGDADAARVWQGLIQAAAALLHRERGNRHGGATLGASALEKLAGRLRADGGGGGAAEEPRPREELRGGAPPRPGGEGPDARRPWFGVLPPAGPPPPPPRRDPHRRWHAGEAGRSGRAGARGQGRLLLRGVRWRVLQGRGARGRGRRRRRRRRGGLSHALREQSVRRAPPRPVPCFEDPPRARVREPQDRGDLEQARARDQGHGAGHRPSRVGGCRDGGTLQPQSGRGFRIHRLQAQHRPDRRPRGARRRRLPDHRRPHDDVDPGSVRRGGRAEPAHASNHHRGRRRHHGGDRGREIPRRAARRTHGRRVKVVQIPNGQFVENCYLVVDETTAQCAIIDPGEEAGLVLEKVAAARARPVAIWITHAHIDHTMGVASVRGETGAPVYLHRADRGLYDHVVQQGSAFGIPVAPAPPPDGELVPGETVRVGNLSFTVRHAPGHSPGSVCLVGEGVVFTGDVLFSRSIGRTHLPGGDFETLIRRDRKSTRLNSSHSQISYAVFCLKKKKKKHTHTVNPKLEMLRVN